MSSQSNDKKGAPSTHTTRREVLSGVSALGVISLVGPAAAAGTAADLVLLNGRITTMDPKNPEATALAAKDGVFLAVGSDKAVRRFIDDLRKRPDESPNSLVAPHREE
ncbi:MAG: hypothetical protein AAFP04_14265, partial [Myxococcota bacterium]